MSADAARLRALRDALLALHKTLLDSERIRYERIHGKIPGAGQFLQLVLNDSWFAWLRQLSGLVVQFDEMLEADEPASDSAVAALLQQTRALLKPAEEEEGFGGEYHRALQEEPDVVLAHREVARLL